VVQVIPVIVGTSIVVATTRPICPKATLTEFSIPVSSTPPASETVTVESVVKYIASSSLQL